MENGHDDDPCDELWDAVMALQSRRVGGGRPAELLDDAVALVQLSRAPRFDGCQAQTCASDQLLEIYGLLDASGYAAERESIAAKLRERLDVTTPCFACLGVTVALGAHARGRSADALAILAELEAKSAISDSYTATYYRGRNALATLQIAAEIREAEAARTALAVLARLDAAVHRWAPNRDEEVEDMRRDVIEQHAEGLVYEAIARDEIEEAVERYDRGVRSHERSSGRIDVELLLLERAPQRLWGRLREVGVNALEHARERGYTRHCCRAVLVLHSWGMVSDADARAELAEQIPLLRSDDLTARARAMGLV
jgi:hypothetical protein